MTSNKGISGTGPSSERLTVRGPAMPSVLTTLPRCRNRSSPVENGVGGQPGQPRVEPSTTMHQKRREQKPLKTQPATFILSLLSRGDPL